MAVPAVEAAPIITIHAVDEELSICEPFIQGGCLVGLNCPLHHYHTPYLWQALISNQGNQAWSNLVEPNERIEDAYCSPRNEEFTVEVIVTQANGTQVPVLLCINFENMVGKVFLPGTPEGAIVQMRRLSTQSYGTVLAMGGHCKQAVEQLQTVKYCTQWRWYFEENKVWKCFESTGVQKLPGSPAQSVLETKYLHGQEVYRFTVEQAGQQAAQVFLLDFRLGHMICPVTTAVSQSLLRVRRRPLFNSLNFIRHNVRLQIPEVKVLPYASSIPENWAPLDTSREYELIPLNPEAMEFHLVKSEFQRSVQQGRVICDVFRIQNPNLWDKYISKKKQMELRGIPLNERQLFHGTSDDDIVQAIFHQNFDWRMSGKNATVYGRGSYFAVDAGYSDRYTGRQGDMFKVRWVFLARILAGRPAMGQKDVARPPPLDPSKPHGELHDSCVDHPAKPKIFVIFDTDQCYPEYVISYKLQNHAFV